MRGFPEYRFGRSARRERALQLARGVKSTGAEAAAAILEPGYGLAVAQAQHELEELVTEVQDL